MTNFLIAGAAAEGAVNSLKDKIPSLYPDLLQPAVKVVGKGLTDTIKLALIPISASIWGYDKIGAWLSKELEKRFEKKPEEENIVYPNVAIIGPAVEAIKFLEEEAPLRDLFAQLIASSMLEGKAKKVHPGFVEIIKNLSSEDALVLQWFFEYSVLSTYYPMRPNVFSVI